MRTIGTILGTIAFIVIAIAFFIEVVSPSLNWSAAAEPGLIEEYLADRVIDGWVGRNAPTQTNPLTATTQNLKMARDDYREHCAGCHGLDGSARNQLEAKFYPPVAKLVDDESQMTDGQLYFIIAKGIRYSGMPAFETDNNREQIWRFVLWVRRLTRLTPQEKADIAAEMKAQEQGNKAAPAAH